MEEIQLQDILYMLWKRAWIIILISVLSLVTSGVISFFVLEPEYETYTTLMLGNPQKVGKAIDYQDIRLNQSLVNTYREIARSKTVLSEVIESLELNMTNNQLMRKVNVSLVSNTEIIKITVLDANPKMAMELTNEIAEVFIKHVVNIMQMENVQVIDPAEMPINPVKPNKRLNVAIAGVLGVMFSVFMVFLLEYLDNTIKSPDDVDKHLNLPIMGIIPTIQVDVLNK